MISYENGSWAIGFLWTCRGSVVPKALAWAVPTTILSLALHVVFHDVEWAYPSMVSLTGTNLKPAFEVWTAYNFFIAFVVTFRAGKSYTRWWEGATLLRKATGEWVNAFSSCLAFSASARRSLPDEVEMFQRKLATLMSQLHCTALNTVSQIDDDLNVLSFANLGDHAMEFLAGADDKVEIIMLWIQRLVVEATEAGAITVAPPILSRCFQELSRGVVNVNDVRKISQYLFPFPYAQLAGFTLLLHMILMPVVTAILLEQMYWTGIATFFSVFAFQSLNYVSIELECPFGDDENDLPLVQMQEDFNRTLAALLEEPAQKSPFVGTSMSMAPRKTVVKDRVRNRTRAIREAEIGEMSSPRSEKSLRSLIRGSFFDMASTVQDGPIVLTRSLSKKLGIDLDDSGDSDDDRIAASLGSETLENPSGDSADAEAKLGPSPSSSPRTSPRTGSKESRISSRSKGSKRSSRRNSKLICIYTIPVNECESEATADEDLPEDGSVYHQISVKSEDLYQGSAIDRDDTDEREVTSKLSADVVVESVSTTAGTQPALGHQPSDPSSTQAAPSYLLQGHTRRSRKVPTVTFDASCAIPSTSAAPSVPITAAPAYLLRSKSRDGAASMSDTSSIRSFRFMSQISGRL